MILKCEERDKNFLLIDHVKDLAYHIEKLKREELESLRIDKSLYLRTIVSSEKESHYLVLHYRDLEGLIQLIYTDMGVYVLNDNGQTIERLFVHTSMNSK